MTWSPPYPTTFITLEKISNRGIHDKALYHDFIMILSWFQNFIMKLSILLSWIVFCYHEPQMLYHEFYLLSWYFKLIHRKVSKLLEFGIKIYFTLSWFYHEPKMLYHDFLFCYHDLCCYHEPFFCYHDFIMKFYFSLSWIPRFEIFSGNQMNLLIAMRISEKWINQYQT